MKVFTVPEPVFKTEPLFVVDCTAAEAAAYLQQRFRVSPDIPNDLSGTMLTFQRTPWRVIWVRRFSRSPSALGPVLHELFHLVTRICADRGIEVVAHHPSGMNGDETAAYLFEFFAKAVLRRVR